ncbi:ABC transporter ATP-binding protein [Lacihabitans sp. LS3-19]|uniref:ABC transporter ATP-binding protein n=1 Tax=Lacihabitans sp. LS3-19 TaxID=2487335 RepID=UPI0020CBE522|nr:ABC transporter ATP-binding protein [Lacihabitans sp. LS3-19]MCP9767641.1 ABC transporter ATP-binding protein [Lacihabitans sp. LS3-19]
MTVLNIENVSKKYQLHQKGNSNDDLRDTLTRWSKNILKPSSKKSKTEEFWALKDINLEVKQGDRLGLVGANGAGKSTLLKVLSQITEPTTGIVRVKGRMASLLEVGTGFHPELTGRENIFLNGAILGMHKSEILKHFEAIVEFAGISKFIDTPVKRYSSGMYVRLGFAIAAHLEPEILVVDEVLAVGDADFQKKSIGKMRDVSNSGRTLIFVSHNLTAVQGLCDKGAYLRGGELIKYGKIDEVVNEYVKTVSKFQLKQNWATPEEGPGNEQVRIKSISLLSNETIVRDNFDTRTPLKMTFEYWNLMDSAELNVSLFLYSMTGECVFNIGDDAKIYKKGIVSSECLIPGDFLNDGSYYISVMIVKDRLAPVYFFEDALAFDIIDYREGTDWYGKWPGAIRPKMISINSVQKELL